jgi:hypothetical protein
VANMTGGHGAGVLALKQTCVIDLYLQQTMPTTAVTEIRFDGSGTYPQRVVNV